MEIVTASRPVFARLSHPESDRVRPQRPLRTKFLLTSMPIGGAETLLVNLIRKLHRDWIDPSVVCFKSPGPLGELLAKEVNLDANLIYHKWDASVLIRLSKLFRKDQVDAVVTVGAGDKMFWGRIAARMARVPVVCCALHSTGWPDGVGRLNRSLTSWTDAFIGVAKSHGEFLRDFERFPASKVVVIPNGVDTDRFVPNSAARADVRNELGLTLDTKIVGIIAALRPEKNHELFLNAAKRVLERHPKTCFTIIGDGDERTNIEQAIHRLGIQSKVLMLGSRSDTPRLLAAMDAFALTSHNEASPVSILEALSCQVPVVATRVGSVAETVIDQWNGFTVEPGNALETSDRLCTLLASSELALQFGTNGREHVTKNGSLENMVRLYEELVHSIYNRKENHDSSCPTPLQKKG